ncbi:MAG: alanine racemase [Myxococcales bacterium]|nr:alanine racemase [Myxococcales bacterium]
MSMNPESHESLEDSARLSGWEPDVWIELSQGALAHNVALFRSLLAPGCRFMAVVKANAYGHGMVPIAQAALAAGADWLGVFHAGEGLTLRAQGVTAPILVLGPTPPESMRQAVDAGLCLTVASPGAADALVRVCAGQTGARAHLKVETGTHRQGFDAAQLINAAQQLVAAGIAVEGLYTHYADIEDTTDHTYAESQLARFSELRAQLAAEGVSVPLSHTACTAAAILFPATHFDMVRVGIGLYGLWPSKETRVSAGMLGRDQIALRPVMTWKTRIRQIKTVPAGSYIGYGRTFRTTHDSRVAILPVGYADGYDRHFSSRAHVLVRGVRAPVLGRICMNLTMIDVTDIVDAAPGDEVVLLGQSGDEAIQAADLGSLAGTIHYEIVTRAAPCAPRRWVP